MPKIRVALAAFTTLAAASVAAPSMAAILAFTPLPFTQGVTSIAGTTDFNTAPGATTATFTDDFLFTLDSTYKTALTATFFNDGFPAANDVVTSATIQVFEGIPGSSVAVSPAVTAGDPLSIRTSATLSPGVDYYLQVASVIPGGDISQYGVTATVAPVSSAPEPGTWALMFAGVAMVGGALRMARRGTKFAAA